MITTSAPATLAMVAFAMITSAIVAMVTNATVSMVTVLGHFGILSLLLACFHMVATLILG